MPERLTQENWMDWHIMGRRHLLGASQMVWQNRDEMAANNSLFGKVTGHRPMNDRDWRNAITWSGAVLLALSIEQSLKAIAIRVKSECFKAHDLELLWNDIRAEDREGVAVAAQLLGKRANGTRLAEGASPDDIEGWTEVIRHHKATFESARYHLESLARRKRREDLSKNLELWLLALAASEYAIRMGGPI